MLALKLGQSLTNTNADSINADTYSIQVTGTEYLSADGFASEADGNTGSVSLWTKVSTMSTTGAVFQLRYDSDNFIQMIYHASSNELRLIYKAAGSGKTARITDAIENDGTWHHIFGTWDSRDGVDAMTIYLDGVLKDTTTTLNTFAGTPTLFDIGQNTQDGNFYKGYLDEFSFFDAVLEIATIYPPKTPVNLTGLNNLVGYWRFEEGTGSTASDSSGNGNAGTLYNSPTWTTDTP